VKKLINKPFLFVLSLLIIAAIRLTIPEGQLNAQLRGIYPDAQEFVKTSSSPPIYTAVKRDTTDHEDKIGYVSLTKATGYGGPMTVATAIDLHGNVVRTRILRHKDTPAFIDMLKNKLFLEKFNGKAINDKTLLNSQVDVVSGATFSSKGVARAVSLGSFAVAKQQFHLPVILPSESIDFGKKEITIIALLVLTLLGSFFKLKKLRWVTLAGGLIFLGFTYNTSLSIANVAGLFLGYIPDIHNNLGWFLLLGGVFISTFLLGKNLYCGWMCPFGACQEATAKLGGGKFTCNKAMRERARKIKYALAYVAILIAILLKNPGQATYEPFAPLFSLNGFGIQWFLLPVIIFSSFFIARIWCHYFCPVSPVLEVVSKAGRKLKLLWSH
jgi:NosR/NirI family transcriptional regulator, nitrous oxide reductase regulator